MVARQLWPNARRYVISMPRFRGTQYDRKNWLKILMNFPYSGILELQWICVYTHFNCTIVGALADPLEEPHCYSPRVPTSPNGICNSTTWKIYMPM